MSSSHEASYKRVYVWELPVRFFHWINAASIMILTATGLVIGQPFTLMAGMDASSQYWFGWVRFIHFLSAYILVINLAVRIYWAFKGNEYAKWHNFIPMKKEQRDEIKEVIKVDVFQTTVHGKISVGHNALAYTVYLGLFVMILIQIITGFGLYSKMSDAWFPAIFGWIVPLLGGDYSTKMVHHILTWFFIIFTIVHVYLTFYHDYVEGRGTISSIVGGWKFEKAEDLKKHH